MKKDWFAHECIFYQFSGLLDDGIKDLKYPYPLSEKCMLLMQINLIEARCQAFKIYFYRGFFHSCWEAEIHHACIWCS